MDLDELRTTWEHLGRSDPLWAILTIPGQEGNRWSHEEFFRSGREEITALVARLSALGRPAGRRRALDFGCGVGRLTQALAGHFDEVVGVDIAASMIGLARQLDGQEGRCRYVHNTGADLAVLEGARFDLVYSSYVLQHMPAALARRYVGEFIRLLAPGGVAVFQLPTGRARPLALVGRVLASPWRFRLARVVASRWLAARGRGGGGVAPAIDMYPSAEGEVRRWIEAAGGRTLQVTPIFAAFSAYALIKWDHRCYFVARAGP